MPISESDESFDSPLFVFMFHVKHFYLSISFTVLDVYSFNASKSIASI